MSKRKRVSYHVQKSQKINERILSLQKELPALCTDFFRSISQTTTALTRLAYAYDLRLFFRYVCDELVSFANSVPVFLKAEDMERITARDIAGFQEYLQLYARPVGESEQDLSPTLVQNQELGIMRKLCSVRSFFEYLFKNELISANVTTLISLPRKREKPILYMEPDEVDKMLSAVLNGDGLTSNQKNYHSITRSRDVAILMMFLGTGIRVSELVGLDIDDIDFDRGAFVVTRKGGNETILYFAQSVSDALKAYLTERQQVETLPGHEHALFLSLQRRRITQRAVENMVKKYALMGAPLKKRLSPHKLRSTFGTNLYEETGDVYLVADALGHADVNTTRRHYAAMSDSRKREASRRISLPDLDSLDTSKENIPLKDT